MPNQLLSEENKPQQKEQVEVLDWAFKENHGQVLDLQGQVRKDVLYEINSGPFKAYFTKQGITYSWVANERVLNGPFSKATGMLRDEFDTGVAHRLTTYSVSMELLDILPNATIVGKDLKPQLDNFYKNSLDACGVRSFGKLVYHEVYPKIDFEVYLSNGSLKYDFIIKPGGNPNDIKLKYQGAQDITIGSNGQLNLNTPLGELIEDAPFSYQGSTDNSIATQFKLNEGEVVSFAIEDYDHQQNLIIDPQVLWSTYYGDAGFDLGYNMVKDGSGNTYMVGWTESATGISSGGHQNTAGGDKDAFLVKFDNAGQRLWATYYGGSGEDRARGVAVDGSGNVYIVGNTASTGMSTAGTYQNSYGGGDSDGFIAKFNSNGVRQWSTYIGGSGAELLTDIKISTADQLFVVGRTGSSDLTTMAAHQNSYGGGDYDGLVLSLDTDGNPSWISFMGGAQALGDHIFKLAVDDQNIYFAGLTASSTGFSSGSVHQTSYGGGSFDSFLTSMDHSGSLRWTSYLGGSGDEGVLGLDIDLTKSEIYMSGNTSSTTGIATTGAHQTNSGGSTDAFLSKFDSDGNLMWSTYLGGSGIDKGRSVSLSKYGVYVTGVTRSTSGIYFTNGETVNQSTFGGVEDAFLVKFNKSGVLKWGTYHGGDRRDLGYGVTFDDNGNPMLVGRADRGLALVGGGYQNDYQNFGDIFIVKYNESFVNEPDVAATNLTMTNLTSTSMQIDWDPGNGDGRVLVLRQGRRVNRAPIDGTTYNANTQFRSAPNLGSGNRVVYMGTCNSVVVTGLRPGRTYHAAVFEYNALEDGTEDYNTTDFPRASAVAQSGAGNEPTVAATNVVITNVTNNSMDVSWTNGNGEARLVVAMVFFDVFNFPVDGVTYTANNNYNLGQNLGFFHRVVYNGTGNNFTLTGLNNGWTYSVAVFEYNGTTPGTEDYLTANPARGFATTGASGSAAAPDANGGVSTTSDQSVNITAAADNIVVSFEGQQSAASVTRVFDMSGREVAINDNSNNPQETIQIPISDLSRPYIVRVQTETGLYSKKVAFVR